MHSAQAREPQTKNYGRVEEPIVNDGSDIQHREQPYYTQPYGVNDRFLSPAPPNNYLPDQFFERNPELVNNANMPTYESTNDGSNLEHYNYVPVTQVHVPSTTHFTVPASRGMFDSTGQQCPPGGRPRVSTTIWEDEGTLCFQVEARQVTVARREDNNMINGTKLLNVAKMSRGKRDGILKNEAVRSVIKVGSMHLKGVWIPFDRALELANKNHVTDMLYPLFVKDIKRFLYHPQNFARTTAVLAAANHRQARQTQPNGLNAESVPEERPVLDRSVSMPTPLDRSLSMLTPPSSASTNSDYWTSTTAHAPISDTHVRTHSLPGTPATTPPAPGYFSHHNQQHPLYPGTFLEVRPPASGNRYGQQPDMQRSYNHSRNTSMMSYQDEDVSNESSSHSLSKENFAALQPRIPSQVANIQAGNTDTRFQHPHYIQRTSSSHDASSMSTHGVTDARPGPATPGHNRSHSRNLSRGSAKVFNTPNLTTQMGRRTAMTPNGSPVHSHPKQSSRDLSQGSQASLWVQQQQQFAYNTPQQSNKGHARHLSAQLPQIYEETPSCRMAYQLHGQPRFGGEFPRVVENGQIYPPISGSPIRGQPLVDSVASPLTGKKKRERVVSDPEQQYFHTSMGFEERQESLTPPPINRRNEQDEESPKRRRSERTGTHSRSGSVY